MFLSSRNPESTANSTALFRKVGREIEEMGQGLYAELALGF